MKEKTIAVEELVHEYRGHFNFLTVESDIDKVFEKLLYYGTTIEKTRSSDGPERSMDKKITFHKAYSDYYQFEFYVTYEAKGKEKEVKVNSKPKKLWDGSIKIQMTGYIVADWLGQATKNPFNYFLRKIYDHLLRRDLHYKMVRQCKNESQKLMEGISNLVL